MLRFHAAPRSLGIYAGSPAGQRGYERHGRFGGLGPKGYRRSSERIREDVCACLWAVDAHGVSLHLANGEATLEGVVASQRVKRAAEACVGNVSGVREVHSRLRVEPRQERERGADERSATAPSRKRAHPNGGALRPGRGASAH